MELEIKKTYQLSEGNGSVDIKFIQESNSATKLMRVLHLWEEKFFLLLFILEPLYIFKHKKMSYTKTLIKNFPSLI